MDINLEEIGQMVVIAGTVGAGIKYVIINPLQKSIESLDRTIVSLIEKIQILQEGQHDIDKRLVKAEASVGSVHHRITVLEEAKHR